MSDEQPITFQIDGNPAEAPAGTTLLDAARRMGIVIPTLCHYRALSPYGACRVCLVETNERGRIELKTACNTLVQPGMIVQSASERVLRARRMVVELLLARAPEAAPLQALAAELGVEKSRFPRREDACILCGLCVRMCEERMGRAAIGFAHRGIRRRVTVPFDMQTAACQACGACVSICPTHVVDLAKITPHELRPIPSEFDAELGARHPAYISFPQAVPNWATIDAAHCIHFQKGGCGICSEVCEAKAIDYEQQAVKKELGVGAIVLAGGYDIFDARRKSEYGFGRWPNVVNSLQFERILSASGPYNGHLQRPGDGQTPRKIAWIQCVGSRDAAAGNDFCSSVCCMYATKEAIIAKEHESIVEPTIFMIDMRAFGKGFEGFYNRAKDVYGVRYVRSQISSVKENPASGDLILRYVGEDGKIAEEEFQMVVLSTGLEAHRSTGRLADLAGIEKNRFGFAKGDALLPLRSGREGIYLCGAVSGPKDIPETVMESSAAAALCGELLAGVRGTQVRVKEYPAERAVDGEAPRVGVFICHCGTNIASVVDVAAVSEYVRQVPGVVYSEHTIYTCSQDTQERIKGLIQEHNLNRVIVASCTPRTHEPLFQETMREAGLNKYLFEMADIREQCSWVHQGSRGCATAKAKDLVRGSVGKARLLEPLRFKKVSMIKAALVLGAGAAGLTSALSLANQGFQVYLVEKENELGGRLRQATRGLEGQDWTAWLGETIALVRQEPMIEVLTGCEIDQTSGCVGSFNTRLKGASTREIQHGVIVIATGASEFVPTDYLYGQSERVITQRTLEQMLEAAPDPSSQSACRIPHSAFVMIQCVGSRDKERPYCSRVCCGEAVKNALALKQLNPAAKVYVLYRDVRTYQYKEEFYRKAREAGVMFIRFDEAQPPQVIREGGGLKVVVHDALLHRDLALPADWVVLSAATVADKAGNRRLSDLLKLSLNEDGFFMEAHVKLRPVDFANEGIFVCGLAHSPKYTEENVIQAFAAAGRAACLLARDSLEVGGAVSFVDPDKCATCLTCVRECIYNAPFVNSGGKAEIEEAKCQGCGNCASACPGQAISLRTFTDAQERALFHSILKEDSHE